MKSKIPVEYFCDACRETFWIDALAGATVDACPHCGSPDDMRIVELSPDLVDFDLRAPARIEDGSHTDMTYAQREMALYEEAVRQYGERGQILIVIEEMAELTQALLKYLRYDQYRQGNLEQICRRIDKERADVNLVLNYLDVIFGDCSDDDAAAIEHLERLLNGTPESET